MKIRNVLNKRVLHPCVTNRHDKRYSYDFNNRELVNGRKIPTLPTISEGYAEYLHYQDMLTIFPEVSRKRKPIRYIGDIEDIKDFAYNHLDEFCDL